MNTMKLNTKKLATSSFVALAVALAFGSSPALAVPFTGLGSAGSFAVLGASTVTNTNPSTILGPTTIFGNVGVWNAGANDITGLLSTQVTGTMYEGPAPATSTQAVAQADAHTAYDALAGLAPTTTLSGSTYDLDLHVGSFTAGVYKIGSAANWEGTITLDAQGLANQSFVFQIGSTLITGSASFVNVINGNASTSVYWQVGSSATLGTGTTFAGNILADQSITLTTGARILCGRAIALEAAVTMDTNIVSNDCNALSGISPIAPFTNISDFGSGGFSGVAAIPEPEIYAMMASGLGLMGWVARRRKQKAA